MTSYHIRILHLEDNVANARLVEILLEEAGLFSFSLEQHQFIEDALKAFNPESYDLILSDLNLPDCNGMETIERWRAAAPNLPLVISSGHDETEMVVKAVEAGAHDYLISGGFNDGQGLALRLLLAFLRKQQQTQP
ncbi:MAG: response regulator [Bacteroidota bacterium]